MRLSLWLLLGWLGFSAQAGAEELNLAAHPPGIWSILGTATDARWIVIHNLAEAQTTGIYHIEVLQRGLKDPVWQIQRLADHIAITTEALKRSVIKPLNHGAVYPERFEDALRLWQSENQGAGGPVCRSSVLECLAR